MTKPLVTGFCCTLIAFVLGVSAWLSYPTGRSFSYLNDTRPTYRIEVRWTLAMLERKQPRPQIGDLADTVKRVSALVPSETHLYSTFFVSTPSRLVWRNRAVPSPRIVGVYGDYLGGRDLRLMAGTLPGVNQPEIVLSERTARALSDDPTELLGQTVVLDPAGVGISYRVTGIVSASPWRSSDADPDAGGFQRLDPSAPATNQDVRIALYGLIPQIMLVFPAPPTASVLQSLERYIAEELPGFRVYDANVATREDITTKAILERLNARSQSLPLLAVLLTASGLLSLAALLLSQLLRTRALLGVDLALGAPRRRLLLEGLTAQAVPAVIGAVVGTAGLFALPTLLPDVVQGSPPLGVIALAVALPPTAAVLLAFMLLRGVLRDPALALLRGARPGEAVRPLIGLMLLAFTLAAGGLFSALGVQEKLSAQAVRVKTEFGRVLEWTTSGDSDSRKGESASFSSRSLGSADLEWISSQPEVRAATIAERMNPNFRFNGKTVTIDRPIVGDDLAPTLEIRVLEGAAGGCMLTAAQAQRLGVRVGSVLEVPAKTGFLPCPVSGILENPDALKSFVMESFPGMTVPSRIGLVGKQGDMGAADPTRLLTTGLLVRLNVDVTPTRLAALRARIAAHRPGLRFTLRPYAPSIDALLAQLERQSQLFLALAGLGTLVALLGLLAGFVAYLDASRYRIALERTQGLSLRALLGGWVRGGLLLGLVGTGVGLLIATPLSAALYNAFSLDAPVGMALDLLPEALPALPGWWTLTAALAMVVLLTLALLQLGVRWLQRHSLIDLLKAGS